MQLYQMTAAAKNLYDLLDSGEIDEQILHDTLEEMGATAELQDMVLAMKSCEADVQLYDAEIARLKENKRIKENRIEFMKRMIIEYMRSSGQKSANAGTFKLTMRENKSCEITNESEIPLEYLREIPAKYEPDKNALKAALKSGKEIPGCTLKTSYSVTAK